MVEQEADEGLYWLEIIQAFGWVAEKQVSDLTKEANELVAIFTTIGKKSKR